MEEAQQIPDWIPNNILSNVDHNLQLTQLFKLDSQLHRMQRNNTLCDVIIKVGDTSFQAHKLVLAASSEFFSTMFTSDFRENYQGEVNLNGKPEVFQNLLDFSYSGKLNLLQGAAGPAMDCLKMAHYMQYLDVVKRCEQFLGVEIGSNRVQFKEVIDILTQVDVYVLGNLKKKCLEYLAKNFAVTDDFKEFMTVEFLEDVMQRDDLNVDSEKAVFDIALAWLQHDWENRKQFAPVLFQKIRLGVVPVGHLTVTFLQSPELNAIPECQRMIVQVMQLRDSRGPDDMPLSITHPDQFATRTTVTALFSVDQDTYYAARYRSFAKYYNDKTGAWVNLNRFPRLPHKEGSNADSLVVVKGQLYVARGMEATDNPSQVTWPQFLTLDVQKNKWCTLAPMTQRRNKYSLVGLDGHIYAIGGWGEGEDSRVCEVYSISENQWRMIAPLPCISIMWPSSAVAFRGCIFVYAQVRQESQRCAVMKYDPVRNSWAVLKVYRAPINGNIESPVFSGLVVHDGKLYISQQNGNGSAVQVFEVVINHDYAVGEPQSTRATTGDVERQDLIPDGFRQKAFRIKQSVYIICRGYCYKTHITVSDEQEDPVNLEEWKWLEDQGDYEWNLPCAQAHVIKFTFDKAVWK